VPRVIREPPGVRASTEPTARTAPTGHRHPTRQRVNGLNRHPGAPEWRRWWTLSGVDPVTGNGAAFQGGALHLTVALTHHLPAASAWRSPTTRAEHVLGPRLLLRDQPERERGQPVVHVTLIKRDADSKFASGFTESRLCARFKRRHRSGRHGRWVRPGNEWYSRLSRWSVSPGGQNTHAPSRSFRTTSRMRRSSRSRSTTGTRERDDSLRLRGLLG